MTAQSRPSRFPLPLERVKKTGATLGSVPREPLRPQRPLHEAAADAKRLVPPSGLGLDSSGVRTRMVERLKKGGLRDEAVIAAMLRVPRHEFVDTALAAQAYEDTALPIGHQQTISAPSSVARMIELLMGGDGARKRGQLGRVLEIGTGCGYQAAVLAQLSTQVISVERIKPLHDGARERLSSLLKPGAVRLVHGDGRLGHAPNAPYDSIVAAACGEDLPQAWLEQLAVGGRLVAPVAMTGAQQALVVVDRNNQGYIRSIHETVMFVPLKSGLD